MCLIYVVACGVQCTVEFQKCGMLHTHCLLCLADARSETGHGSGGSDSGATNNDQNMYLAILIVV